MKTVYQAQIEELIEFSKTHSFTGHDGRDTILEHLLERELRKENEAREIREFSETLQSYSNKKFIDSYKNKNV